MSADKAPIEKLPLAVRKNVRDGWESKKAGIEQQLTELFGVPWTCEVNPNAIYPYAEEGSYGHNSLGDCIFAYFNDFIWSVKNSFIPKHGAGGAEELNTVCPKHILTLFASPKFTYCGTEVSDGKLAIVFNPTRLGTNISQAAQLLAETLSTAPQPEGASTLSYAARHSIKTDYEPKIGELLSKAQKLLQNDKLVFEPGFEAIGAKLKVSKDVRDDWETNLGSFTYKYYEAFVDVLTREKFGEDEMLREGLEEAAPKGEIKFKILDTIKATYNEVALEDGALIIQTKPGSWGTNIHYTAEKLVDLL